MDISAPSPISTQATAAAQNALRELPDTTKVAPSTDVTNSRADPHTENGNGHGDHTIEARQILANRERIRDPSTQAGPSPTFQITLLEVEQDLMNILARIEASRAKDRDVEALKPDTSDANLDVETSSDRARITPPADGTAGTETKQPDDDVPVFPDKMNETMVAPLAQAPE